MTTLQRAACSLALFLAGTAAHALTASELVAKNVEAKGGATALEAVRSVRREGRAILNGGQFVLGVLEVRQRPGSIRFESSLQGLTQVQAYDGKEGWKIDPFGGRKDPERLPADDVKDLIEDASIDGSLLDAARQGGKVEYLGTEDIDGTTAHKLKVTGGDRGVQYVFLDPEHFLEIRIESQRTVRGVKRTTVTELGNYEKVGGVYFPLSVETGVKGGSNPAKFEYDTAEVNVDLSPDYFSFPVAARK
jgi:hypothetical protein